MTVANPDRLAELLPTIHRLRDAETGGPLEALLRVVAEQLQLLEDDIAGLYDNWFIETCDPWVVPYIGELIGAAPGSSRRDVAHAIGARRRKGTLALLEELARDVAGWPARAVAFFELLAVAQSVEHLRLTRGRTVDVHDGAALDLLEGPFDRTAHTVSGPRLSSALRRTRYGIPDVGLYVWRLRPHAFTRTPAFCFDRAPNRYTFSTLTNDAPLMTRPIPEPAPAHIADDLNVPGFIRRRAFAERTADFYGPGRSVVIYRDAPDRPVPPSDIVAADLGDWAYEPEGDEVAVDPERGRIAFAPDAAPEEGVWVSYVHGFSADMGGGEYARRLTGPEGRPVYRVGRGAEYGSLAAAVDAWRTERTADRARRSAIVEIADSEVYEDERNGLLDLEGGDHLEIRAAQGARPVLRLRDRRGNRPDALRIRRVPRDGEPPDVPPPSVVLDGLLIAGRAVRVVGEVGCVVIRHCTLVPGWSLEYDCEPRAEEPSVVLDRTTARVIVEHSILGGIRVDGDEVLRDPIAIVLSDSILDATSPTAPAVCGRERRAHAVLTVARCTIIGELHVHAIALAENTIFDGVVRVARRQIGCVRFCYVPDGSRTPARYEIVPDDARPGVRPRFNSRRYGRPDYCQLADDCPPEIARGADDESELGAFHDLFAPQRVANLDARLQDHTPAGTSAAVIFVT